LLEKELAKGPFRLIGIGVSELEDAALADPPDLVDEAAENRKKLERVVDSVRAKFGTGVIKRGRGV